MPVTALSFQVPKMLFVTANKDMLEQDVTFVQTTILETPINQVVFVRSAIVTEMSTIIDLEIVMQDRENACNVCSTQMATVANIVKMDIMETQPDRIVDVSLEGI